MWGNYIPRADGVINDVFAGYSNVLAHTPLAIVRPLLYVDEPDSMDGNAPFMGTVGIFASRGAIVNPDGPWYPDYMGSLPIAVQPHIITPEPWQSPDTP